MEGEGKSIEKVMASVAMAAGGSGGVIAIERDTSFTWMGKPVLSSAGSFRFL